MLSIWTCPKFYRVVKKWKSMFCVQRPLYLMIQSVVEQNGFYGSIIICCLAWYHTSNGIHLATSSQSMAHYTCTSLPVNLSTSRCLIQWKYDHSFATQSCSFLPFTDQSHDIRIQMLSIMQSPTFLI